MTPSSPALDHIPASIHLAQDYVEVSRGFMAEATWEYVTGGSGPGTTAEANLRAFAALSVVPRLLRSLEGAHTRVELPGARLAHPVMLAPVAYQRLAHAGGECETARAAQATDSGLVLSTLSSRTLEEVAAAGAGAAPRWFQLYLQPQRRVSADLVRRAEAAGYAAIVVTLDAALQVPGRRALQLGFRLPPQVQAVNLAPYDLAPAAEPGGDDRTLRLAARHAVSWQDLDWLRSVTALPIWIKGVLDPDDARALRDRGIDGLVVSNHGGRGLEGAPASLHVLPAIRAAVGEGYPLLFDGGVRSGLDVFKALAKGADAVLVGRLQMYALSVAGALGVAHLLRCLREELQVCMALTGCADLRAIRDLRVE